MVSKTNKVEITAHPKEWEGRDKQETRRVEKYKNVGERRGQFGSSQSLSILISEVQGEGEEEYGERNNIRA